MQYVEGFVAAVPTGDRVSFRRHAEEAANVFKRGALPPDTNPMPFDGRRMYWGGFEVLVDV